jgi:hypothetical protein
LPGKAPSPADAGWPIKLGKCKSDDHPPGFERSSNGARRNERHARTPGTRVRAAAERDADEAIRANPTFPEGYYLRGLARSKTNSRWVRPDAIADLEMTLRLAGQANREFPEAERLLDRLRRLP